MDYRVESDGNIWKNGSKTQILEKISRDCLVLGTGNALFSCLEHLSYFDHNLLIYDPILVIQVFG